MAHVYGPAPGGPEPLRPVPDLAGTPVDDAEGRYAGRVYASLVDAQSGLLRYFDLALDASDRHVLVPVGHAAVDRRDGYARIHLRAAIRRELAEIPTYEPHEGSLDDLRQQAVLAAHARLFYGERYYAHPAFDHGGLYAGEHPIVREPLHHDEAPPLELLSRLPGLRVVEGEPDVRGWTLEAGDGRPAGRVADLVVDTAADKARYLAVALDTDRRVLVPVGFCRIEESQRRVRTPALTADDLRALPEFQGRLTRAYERSLRATLDARLSGSRRFHRPDFNTPAGLRARHRDTAWPRPDARSV